MESLNTIGTKLVKNMLIIPIKNTLLYVEPIYQVRLNEKEIPVLKKVIVASGNTVAMGDNLEEAVLNLFNDYAVDLEFVDIEDITALVDSVIKANNNLNESISASDFEMIGKDISRLQAIIKQLETARNKEIEKEKETTGGTDLITSLFGKDEENNTVSEKENSGNLVDSQNTINNEVSK